MENPNQGLLESIVMANNQAQTTESSNWENQMMPMPILDDPNLPLQLPISSSLILNETLADWQFPPTVGLISEGTSQFERDVAAIRCYNPSYQPYLDENLLMSQGFVRYNPVYNACTNNQPFVPNINENNILHGINYHSSNYQPMFQTLHPEEAMAGIGTGIPNGQIMTSQMPNDDFFRYHTLWPEQTMGRQSQQVAPVYANTVTTQRDQAIVVEPSSSRVPPSNSNLDMLNLNAIPMVCPNGPSTFITPQQNQGLNLQNGRELAREEPNVGARRSRDIEGQNQELSYGGYPLKQFEIGESSFSKRQKKDSATEGSAETEPKTQEAEKTPERESQNDNAIISSYVANPRNGLYDPAFEMIGLPIDPHIRLWKAQQDPENNGYNQSG